MQGLFGTIREKTQIFNYTGKVNFDSFEISEMLKSFDDAAELQAEVESQISGITDETANIKKELIETRKLLKDALMLAQINDLPEHFTKAFAEKLDAANNKLDEIETAKDEINSSAEKITDVIFYKGIDN